jgi:Ni/Co efflux regulator RcnB
MNKLLVGLVASSVMAMPSLAAQARSSTTSVADAERQVLKLEREWTAAEIKRDPATLRRILDDRRSTKRGSLRASSETTLT